VFPLLIENFSSQEQASVVWQVICSVPVMVLEEIFPWMTFLLSPNEKSEVENCVKQIVPKEVSLQLVVNSWLIDDNRSSNSFTDLTKIMKRVHSVEVSENSKYRKHSDSCLSLDLNVLVVRLNFLADVLIFYGDAFKKFFYPVFEEMMDQQHSSTSKQFTIDDHVENFKRSLDLESRTRSDNFVVTLQEKLQSLIFAVAKQFSEEETEVFPIISKNCNLSEDESQSIIHFLSWKDFFPNKPFANLLLQWFRFGYSGKTSVESFWNELSFMFKPKSPEEHTEEASGSFANQSQLQPCKNKPSTCFKSMHLPAGYMNETPYSSAMNQQILIPGTLKTFQQLLGLFY
ncbi:hypothetical protein AALP_AAs52369U000100, partial [Arabis alpina]